MPWVSRALSSADRRADRRRNARLTGASQPNTYRVTLHGQAAAIGVPAGHRLVAGNCSAASRNEVRPKSGRECTSGAPARSPPRRSYWPPPGGSPHVRVHAQREGPRSTYALLARSPHGAPSRPVQRPPGQPSRGGSQALLRSTARRKPGQLWRNRGWGASNLRKLLPCWFSRACEERSRVRTRRARGRRRPRRPPCGARRRRSARRAAETIYAGRPRYRPPQPGH